MYTISVSPNILEQRLDSEFYNPKGLEAFSKLNDLKGTKQLFEIVDGSRKITNGVRGPAWEESSYKLIRLQDCEDWIVNHAEASSISLEQYEENKRCKLQPNDIVVAIGGYVGNASIVNTNCNAVIGQHSAVLPNVESKGVDSRYVLAFLNTSIAEAIFERYVSGTVQAGINLEDLRILPIYVPNVLAQKYIGEKVRHAERLRAWAKQIEIDTHKVFNASIAWNKSVLDVKNYGYVKLAELDGRLDLKYNSPERLAVLRHLKKQRIEASPLSSICSISAMIGWKGLTTEFYRESGPWLLRGVEFKKGVVDTESLVCVDEFKYNEQPQIHLKEGDLAFSKDGTIGKAIVIPKLRNRLAAGSTIARLRMKGSANPYYLEFVLSHSIVQAQIESFATGIAQPHITQEWIAKLEVPRVDCEEKIAEYWNTHHLALNSAKSLTKLANLLVEDLIEGQLTESQLVSAQQALEAGDDSLDRALLERMTAEGIDGEGSPLFDDIDQLYDLLDQAKQALDADDTMAEA